MVRTHPWEALVWPSGLSRRPDWISALSQDRSARGKLMRRLEEGDTVIVCRLDRLARSTRDLLNLLDQISEAGATFRSLKDTWADTSTMHGRLLVTILGGIAQFERELTRERTDEGRIRAKARGVRFGSPAQADLASASRNPRSAGWRDPGQLGQDL